MNSYSDITFTPIDQVYTNKSMEIKLITNIKDIKKENLSPFTLKIIDVFENGGRILGVTRNGLLIGITTHYVK